MDQSETNYLKNVCKSPYFDIGEPIGIIAHTHDSEGDHIYLSTMKPQYYRLMTIHIDTNRNRFIEKPETQYSNASTRAMKDLFIINTFLYTYDIYNISSSTYRHLKAGTRYHANAHGSHYDANDIKERKQEYINYIDFINRKCAEISTTCSQLSRVPNCPSYPDLTYNDKMKCVCELQNIFIKTHLLSFDEYIDWINYDDKNDPANINVLFNTMLQPIIERLKATE